MDELIQQPNSQPLFISYTLTPQEVYGAVKTAQYRRNLLTRLIQTAVLLLIFAMYLQAVVSDPTYVMGIMLCILSLFVMGAVWLVPMIQARGAFKKASDMPLRYEIEFNEDTYSVNEVQGENELRYAETEAVETAALILLIVRKTKLFCIPKRAIEEQELRDLKALLIEKLKDDFKAKD